MDSDSLPKVHAPAWRPLWIHFGVLLVLALIAEAIGSGLGQLPEFAFGILPVLAGIAVGMNSPARSGFRHAVWLSAFVTVVMIFLDVFGSHGSLQVGGRVGAVGGEYVASPRLIDFTEVPLMGTVVKALQGDFVIPEGRGGRYPVGHPLVTALQAIQKGGHLMLGVLLVGVVVGIQAWVAERVRFIRPTDERVARIVTAWVLAPTLYFFVSMWAQELRIDVMRGSAPVPVVALPFLAVALASAVGWVAAWRVARWTA